jgi:uncharacterized MAPEG superfamily protein
MPPTTEITYLALTAILTAALWIPYVICQVTTNGLLSPQDYKDPKARPVPLWGERANRAHINAVEGFAPFAALVILAMAMRATNEMTALWTMLYFWIRVAHAVVYIAGIPVIRTLVFVAGFVCIVGLFVEVITGIPTGAK